MAIPQILEVAIGLIVVYYILGMIVSFITKLVTESLETRGVALEQYLHTALGDKAIELKALPQIKARQPIRYKNWLAALTANTEPKKVEKIPAAILVDAVFDITGLTGKHNIEADELIRIVDQLPDSEAKRAMSRWIQQGVTDANELRNRTRDYLCGVLDQAAEAFKAKARSFVIILSIVITLAFGTDSIQLAKDLWNSADLRAVAQAEANKVIQSQGGSTDVATLVNDLSAYSLSLGWWNASNLPDQMAARAVPEFVFFKMIGLAITAVAVSQGSSFWYDILKRVTRQPTATEEIGDGSDS